MNQEGVIARGWVLPRRASHVGRQAIIKEVAKVRLEGILHCLQLLVVVQTARVLGKNMYKTCLCINFFCLHLFQFFNVNLSVCVVYRQLIGLMLVELVEQVEEWPSMSQIHQGYHLPNKLEAVQQPLNKLQAMHPQQYNIQSKQEQTWKSKEEKEGECHK